MIQKLGFLPDEVQPAINEGTTTYTKHSKRRTIKLHDKLTALNMLMKYFGVYVSLKDLVDNLTNEQASQILTKLETRWKASQATTDRETR